MKRLIVLGSTGSLGVQVLEIVKEFPEEFEMIGLSAGRNVALLAEQIKIFRPRIVSIKDYESALILKEAVRGLSVEVVWGEKGLCEVASHPDGDIVISAIAGKEGLLPTYAAVKKGRRIALANKEVLVMAGRIIREEAQRSRSIIIPVDSEHSAIFQVLLGQRKEDVKRLILTASGGPFLNYPMEKLSEVTPEQALCHPKWRMGKKISIDSASLMNKVLEIIEARWLFDIPSTKIEVKIHPESIVHSMVEFRDGSVLAQMGITDMRIPISYALSFPSRLDIKLPSLELEKCSPLTFIAPDERRFPSLRLAYYALERENSLPVVLNAADEVAVDAFLKGRIRFTDIPVITERAMEEYRGGDLFTIEEVLEVDRWTRMKVEEFLRKNSL